MGRSVGCCLKEEYPIIRWHSRDWPNFFCPQAEADLELTVSHVDICIYNARTFSLNHVTASAYLHRRILWLTVRTLSFRVVLKNLRHIISGDSTKIRFSLKTLDDVLTHLYAALLLTIIQKSWYHFCPNFLHTQIFGDNPPNTVLFHVQLTCDHLNCQSTISTHHLPYPLDFGFYPSCWTPPAPGVIFHLFAIFEPIVPLENKCTRHLYTLTEAFQVIVIKSSTSRLKIPSFFVAQSTSFVSQCL